MNWSVRRFDPPASSRRERDQTHRFGEQSASARGVAVGNVIFLSGCVGQHPTDDMASPDRVEDQVALALENARAAMEEAGSSMDNIVKTFFTVRRLDDYPAIRKTETEYYEANAPLLVSHPPAATLIVVDSLARPEFHVQYEAIGVVDRNAPGWSVTYYPEYWGGKKLAYPHVPKEHAKFARTEVVGNLVFVSGCQALDHETVRVETHDFKEQTRIVLDKLRIGIEETGGSLGNLVKTTVLLDDVAHYSEYRAVERAYFQEHAPNFADDPPASTVIHATGLPRPEFLVEVEAIGVVDKALSGWETRFYQGTDDAALGVSTGKLLFLSACDGSDPGTGEIETDSFEEQMATALGNVRTALAETGTAMDNVIKTVVMLKRPEDYPTMRQIELAYFEEHAPQLASNPPASTFMQLPSITSPKGLVQIDATAVL